MLAIFGISGDLAKKMTFRALYRMEVAGQARAARSSASRSTTGTTRQLREHAREAVDGDGRGPRRATSSTRARGRLSYVQGDYADDATFKRVKKAIGGAKQPVFYLEIPPSLFATVVQAASARRGWSSTPRW